MKKLILATRNPGKILEYQAIFRELKLPLELLTLDDAKISGEPEEDGKTFEENAVKKANFYSQLTELPVLADDSGLEVDFLNGEPGVYSRRWPSLAEVMAGKLGSDKSDEQLLQMLEEKMKEAPAGKRGAQFRVTLAFKKSPAAKPILSDGILRGRITEKPMAKIIPGFPFRSLFYVEELGKTLGELSMKEESRVAHRRIAIAKILAELMKI